MSDHRPTGQCVDCGAWRELAPDGTERCWLCVRLNSDGDTPGAVADRDLLRREGRL